jgi:formate/nitrite transporter FocA (FNT family)
MHRVRDLIEEAIVAAVALAMIGVFVSTVFWFSTGSSPWPGLVLAEAVTFVWGLLLVVITSPAWRR